MGGFKTEVPLRHAAQVFGALGVVFWRILEIPSLGLLRDWLFLLSCWWLGTVFAEGRRSWRIATAVFVSALMALYAWGQIPYVLSGAGPPP
jgi:hypothetical protein